MNVKNPSLRFRKAWSWPRGVEDFLRHHLVSPSLHVCCGESELGDVRVDAYLERPGLVKADMLSLPFTDESFASILIDPPWHLPYHLRPKLAKELGRVLRPGGILLFNSPWRIRLQTLTLEAVYWADVNSWRNVPLIMIYRKQPTLT